MNTHVIAITHRGFELKEIGNFHIAEEDRAEVLTELKNSVGLCELMYLSTCNRVEFIFTSNLELNAAFLRKFFTALPSKTVEVTLKAISSCETYSGDAALEHLFSVASSLDSLVVGEREIITQVRNAYESSVQLGLAGDTIRLLINKTIATAKRIYTEIGRAHV